MRGWAWVVASAFLGIAAACSCGDGTGGPRDAGEDAGETDSGAVEDAGRSDAGRDAGGGGRDRSTAFVTGGGANASSPRYRLRFSVGAPLPAGEASGSGRRILLGPAASPEP
jgi:hypothetical protein